jgi:ABC-type glycerol-3-phosphate transport system substrate-binding protein
MPVQRSQGGLRTAVARPRRMVALAAGMAVGLTLAACGDSGGGTPTLTWYTNPDNGGQEGLAKKCTEAANGDYKIEVAVLPSDASSQREQLVRRLAAKDSSIDLMSLDPVFVPEFAAAGFLRPFTDAEAPQFTDGVLDGSIKTSMWDGKLVAAPFWANTQLLWYRKSVARKAGIDPVRQNLTWDQIIDAAKKTDTTVEVTGGRYEGYMVWINSLVASAGGAVLKDPQAGKDATPTLDSPAGKQAADIIHRVATDGVADPQLSTATEETARNGFQADNGGFMVNWPYVYGAALAAVEDGSLDQSIVDDIGWARVPRVDAGTASAPPFGGINLGIGAYGKHTDAAVAAASCITSEESQKSYMLSEGNPAARAAVFSDPEVIKKFPMAAVIENSIDTSTPRPESSYYPDVSTATVREFHPPSAVNPDKTPKNADDLITDVLNGDELL